MTIKWKLRNLMFNKGMYQTTQLIQPLHERGVALSREQIYRLVVGQPKRVNVLVLDVLCDILECTPNDLLQRDAPADDDYACDAEDDDEG